MLEDLLCIKNKTKNFFLVCFASLLSWITFLTPFRKCRFQDLVNEIKQQWYRLLKPRLQPNSKMLVMKKMTHMIVKLEALLS